MDQLVESFTTPVSYILDADKSGQYHKYYLFKIGDANYRVNISRISSPSKTSYMFTLGSLSDKGTMKQFKFDKRTIYSAISTAISIFKEWHDVHKNIFTSVIFKMPDKMTPPQMKIIERMIKKQKIPNLEKILMNGVNEAKHKYLFYKNTKKADDAVLKSLLWKGFDEYGFKDAFPAELLDKVMLHTKLEKSHIMDQLELMVKGVKDSGEVAIELAKNVSAQEMKVIDQKEAAIEIVDNKKEDIEVTREGKEAEITEVDMEYHWSKPIGLTKRILVVNDLIAALDKKGKLEGLVDYLSKDFGDDEVDEYDDILLFVDIFSKHFFDWTPKDSIKNSEMLRKIIFDVPTDYIKYLEFHLDKNEEYLEYTPYIFYGNKKSATDKLLADPKTKLVKKPVINGFYSKLSSNIRMSNSIGRITHEGTTASYFPALFSDWDMVNFLIDHTSKGMEYNTSMINTINTEAYYAPGRLSTKQDKMIENSEIEVLEFIPLKGIEVPNPVNNIFSSSGLSELEKELYSIQKQICSPSDVPKINAYTGSWYGHLNGGLRDMSVAKSRREDILLFMNEFKKYSVKLSMDLEVSRKVSHPSEMTIDKTYVDFAPLSTSIYHGPWSGTFNLKILIPKGTPVFFALKGFSNHSNEKELILPPGSIIKPIRKIQLKNGKQKWIECICMGNVFSHIYETIDKINDTKDDIGVDMGDMFDSFMDESMFKINRPYRNRLLNEVMGIGGDDEVDDNYDREKAIIEDKPFADSEEIVDMIKNGVINPEYYFENKG